MQGLLWYKLFSRRLSTSARFDMRLLKENQLRALLKLAPVAAGSAGSGVGSGLLDEVGKVCFFWRSSSFFRSGDAVAVLVGASSHAAAVAVLSYALQQRIPQR